MISVLKNDEIYPFSKGILASSISPTGLPMDEIYEIVFEILHRLEEEGVTEIESDKIQELVSKKLRERGHEAAEKYYRVSRKIRKINKPLFVLIAGATGVGKSSISAELAHRLGIERVINTDTIREIMRYMIPKDLMPSLHYSSFMAGEGLRITMNENKVLAGFNEQVSLVSQGVKAFIQRIRTEGLKTILNGIHLVPGYLDLDIEDESMLFFHYFLDLKNEKEHKQRFHYRAEGSLREPRRYIDHIDSIRMIQDHIREQVLKYNVQIIQNDNFERTLQIIMQDLITTLESEVLDE